MSGAVYVQINHLSLYQIRFLSLQASVKCPAISDVQFAESNNSTPVTQIPQRMITVPYFPLNTSRNPLVHFHIFHNLSLQNSTHCQSTVLRKCLAIVMQQDSKYPIFSPRLQILVGKKQPPWLSTFVSVICMTVKIIFSEWSFKILYQLQNVNGRKNIIMSLPYMWEWCQWDREMRGKIDLESCQSREWTFQDGPASLMAKV